MRINLPAITFIVAFALLFLGAVVTSSTLWAGEEPTVVFVPLEAWQGKHPVSFD